MDFATTVGTLSLDDIDADLATLAPDATAGTTRLAEGCLVSNHLRRLGFVRACVAPAWGRPSNAGWWAYQEGTACRVGVPLPAAVSDLARRFDDVAGADAHGGHRVDVRTCRRLIRELQATPEALPATREQAAIAVA